MTRSHNHLHLPRPDLGEVVRSSRRPSLDIRGARHDAVREGHVAVGEGDVEDADADVDGADDGEEARRARREQRARLERERQRDAPQHRDACNARSEGGSLGIRTLLPHEKNLQFSSHVRRASVASRTGTSRSYVLGQCQNQFAFCWFVCEDTGCFEICHVHGMVSQRTATNMTGAGVQECV